MGALGEDGALAPLDEALVLRHAEEMAARGLRVLAFARREMPTTRKLDPPRLEVIKAVAKCRAAGIQVKMITGDHVLTATVIAAQIGLDGGSA